MSDELKIKINPEDITALVREAIMAKITDQQAQAFVKEAVDAQFKKERYDEPSRVMQAFSDGARQVLKEIVSKEFEKPERQAQLQEVFIEAWSRMFDKSQREALLDKLADQMRKGLTGDRY